MSKIEVMGRQNVNGNRNGIGWHEFHFSKDGVTQYVDGEKRAEITADNWAAFCESCPEAAEAERRRAAAASAASATATESQPAQ